MKRLKDVQKFENVFLVPAKINGHTITPMVYTDSYYKDDYRVICVSDSQNIHRISVSKKCFDDGENIERVLETSVGLSKDYMICADEDVARAEVFERMYREEKNLKEDILKARALIKNSNKALIALRREMKLLKNKK